MKTQFAMGLSISILTWTLSLSAQTPEVAERVERAPATRVEAIYTTDADSQHKFSRRLDPALAESERLKIAAAQSAADYFLADPTEAPGSTPKNLKVLQPGVIKSSCFGCHSNASRRMGTETEYLLSFSYPGPDGKTADIDRVINFPKLDEFLTATFQSLPDFLKKFRAAPPAAKREYVMLSLAILQRLKRDVGRMAQQFGPRYDATRDEKHLAALENFFVDSGIISRPTLEDYYALEVPFPTSFHDLPVHLAVRLRQGAKVDALKEKFSSLFADLGLSETQITDLFVRSRSLKMLPDKN